MVNKRKRKRRLGKSLAQRQKEVHEIKTARAWRRIWVNRGILEAK